ncbi:hypothetical protein NUH88_05905 [Nisaea acidiphila]|uniref:Uncharacterized protein n=1 Tax=Nisaea acidiphila TaxID=1862145 RepID=A0A9J7AV64_9PROT|nr:hypothetical protein [Nisaea acidiphila]UUX51223.1 hypothetical protein NUH88_05905 [Nisaea acidiphila]
MFDVKEFEQGDSTKTLRNVLFWWKIVGIAANMAAVSSLIDRFVNYQPGKILSNIIISYNFYILPFGETISYSIWKICYFFNISIPLPPAHFVIPYFIMWFTLSRAIIEAYARIRLTGSQFDKMYREILLSKPDIIEAHKLAERLSLIRKMILMRSASILTKYTHGLSSFFDEILETEIGKKLSVYGNKYQYYSENYISPILIAFYWPLSPLFLLFAIAFNAEKKFTSYLDVRIKYIEHKLTELIPKRDEEREKIIAILKKYDPERFGEQISKDAISKARKDIDVILSKINKEISIYENTLSTLIRLKNGGPILKQGLKTWLSELFIIIMLLSILLIFGGELIDDTDSSIYIDILF